jgi:hypothetical protein
MNSLPLPLGTYLKSSKNVSLDGDILTCDLGTFHGTYVRNIKRIYANTEYYNMNGVLTPYNYENSYFIMAENQLGNCLRIILSGLIIANTYNKHPFICLDHIGNNKERLMIETLFRQYILYQSVNFHQLNYINSVQYAKLYYTNYHLIDEGRFSPPEHINSYGITNNIYSVIPVSMTEDEYTKRKINIYRNLIYPVNLSESIHNFITQHNISTCIGVHLRYTDNFNCHNKMRQQLNTTYKTFIDKMNSQTNVTYFVCSDNNDILSKISSDSINEIIFIDKCFDKQTQPFYEMNILAHCKSIIGSNSSTFSYEAAFLWGTDIELYENNAWKLYDISKYRLTMDEGVKI